MSSTHLTLRFAADLARALARRARERGRPKSELVREALSRYLARDQASDVGRPPLAAAALAARWSLLPHLTPQEADGFGADLAAERDALPIAATPWE